MSKRSKRRTRAQRKKKQTTVPGLVQRGRQAFQQENYALAIDLWQQAYGRPNAPVELTSALAEAYFRRAVTDAAAPIVDLKHAAQLTPTDPRYRYHLALAYHRHDNPAAAESLYRDLLAQTPPFLRAALPLAQLLIEQKKALLKDPVWALLSAREQTQLRAVDALVKKKAASTMRQLSAQPLDPVWRGLLALALKDPETARENLQLVVDRPDAPTAWRSIAQYYLGVLDVTDEQLETAFSHWRAAQENGMASRYLEQNLADLAFRLAVQAQQTGQPQRAAELLEQIPAPLVGRRYYELYRQLEMELAYQAAQKGNWAEALTHWQHASGRGENSRTTTFNLALAYQHTEDFRAAAEHWRRLLRRRPRKADHPDALSKKQVARIWQYIADDYTHSGDYDEAIKTYKNAIKWAPDNIDLRLKLVQAYQETGHWQAAENEVNRVLEKNPDYVPALVLLAEGYQNYYFPTQARDVWQHILTLEPKHPVARQQLAYTYEQEAERISLWGGATRVIEIYREGLKQVPGNPRLLLALGSTYAEQGDLEQARHYLEQAYTANPTDLQVLHTSYQIWIDFGDTSDLERIFNRVIAISPPVPGAFFLDLTQQCIEMERLDEAIRLFEYVEKHYRTDTQLAVGVALGYLSIDREKEALVILRRILQDDPTHAEANLHLGIFYHHEGQTRLAQRHWVIAEKRARKENDHILLYRIKMVTDDLLYNRQANPLQMLLEISPEVRAELAKNAPPEIAEILQNASTEELLAMMAMFNDDYDDDDDDDDFFF